MGGNAFEKAERVTAQEYKNLCDDISWALRNIMGQYKHFCIPLSVREKDSHGDVDVLVVGSKIEAALKQMKNAFLVEEQIDNPSGHNLLVYFEGKRIQVDLNKVADDDFQYASIYFSWNDCGNLIGRIAHRQGLKHGHDGLWYVHRKGDHQLGEILLTKSYLDALIYLGFDVDEHDHGFDTFEQMFEWVKKSKHFEACAFPLEHRNHAARTRDAKRKTYNAFLRWLDFQGEYVESDKAAWLEIHKRHWPNLAAEIVRLDQEYELNTQYKERVNGIIVREMTGVDGKELGKLMNYVKRVLPRESTLKHDVKTIEAGIMFAYQIYLEEKRNETHS